MTKRVGAQFTGLGGLGASMVAASAVTLPFAGAGHIVGHMDPQTFALSALAALLLPILPYTAEMVALRNLPTTVFGTLMSLEPAIGTVAGFVLLAEQPSWAQSAGVVLVTVAGMGAVRSEARQAVGDLSHQSSGPKQKTPDQQGSQLSWCPRGDLNPHAR
ncbi:EamA family transporter [Streptomyces sp. NPDC088357]|uniref:EamA family transporter n=1 Tax=Streptomyces sp. NPDC088357 TaxID=3154655 RepID=UPI0034215D72